MANSVSEVGWAGFGSKPLTVIFVEPDLVVEVSEIPSSMQPLESSRHGFLAMTAGDDE